MKKLLLILLCLPTFSIPKNLESTDCQFKYTIQLNKYSGLFSCPYLGPKMVEKLNNLKSCSIYKDDENQIIIFHIDTIYSNQFIENLFLLEIGIPEWSIDNIKIE
jgi:hypothetical protein